MSCCHWVRHPYIEVFRGLKSESDPGGIGFAFHRVGAEIAENSHLWMGTILALINKFGSTIDFYRSII